MKENAHFFISRFPFPPFPISHFHFFVPGSTIVSRARPHPLQAWGKGLVRSMHTSHVNCPGSWQKWFRPIRLQYVLTWPILYASTYAYRDRYFSANALEHCCWLARRLKRLWWVIVSRPQIRVLSLRPVHNIRLGERRVTCLRRVATRWSMAASLPWFSTLWAALAQQLQLYLKEYLQW